MHKLTDADIAAGREVRRFNGDNERVQVVIPWDEVTTWRAACTCCWTGPELPATAAKKYRTQDCPEEIEERVFYPAWQAHVAPLTALHDLGELADELSQLESKLAEKVRLTPDRLAHRGPTSATRSA